MNLTVESLESMHAECVQVIDSGMLGEKIDLLEKYKATADNLELACGMLRDLQIAYESLKETGATTEWMDIVNKDNKFVIACDIELPKLFDNQKARTEACMEGAWDTIKKWLQVALTAIREIFNFIVKCAKAIMAFMSRESGKTLKAEFEIMEKVAKNATDIFTESDIRKFSCKDPVMLKRYMDELDILIAILITKTIDGETMDLKKITDDPDDLLGAGVIDSDVTTTLTIELAKRGKTADKNHYGYVFTNSDIEFIDVKAIPDIEVAFVAGDAGLAHVLEMQDFLDKQDANETSKLLNSLLNKITAHQKRLESLTTSAFDIKFAGLGGASLLTAENRMINIQRGVARCRVLYRIVQKVLTQYWSLVAVGEGFKSQLIKSLSELKRKYPQAFK